MIVLDASAAVELALRSPAGMQVGQRALSSKITLHASYLIDIEVQSTLRRMVLRKLIDVTQAEDALEYFADLIIERHEHTSMLWQMWRVRSSLTTSDASYVVLARGLGATVLTCDGKMWRSHGHGAKIEYVPLKPSAKPDDPPPATN